MVKKQLELVYKLLTEVWGQKQKEGKSIDRHMISFSQWQTPISRGKK